MSAYYNEFDPKAAAWLRELIKAGHIAAGEVDERSILEVRPDDLRGFTQCHFFAGIGVWSYALRNAGWPDDRPVWTGSCPCQPFSAAGKGDEFADERHLWPAWFRLARELRPDAIFGEQVSSKDALAWFDHVRVDLEGEDYAVGVLDTCAAGVGAPHIRQRLYFVADAGGSRHARNRQEPIRRGGDSTRTQPGADGCGAVGGLGDPQGPGLAQRECQRGTPAEAARHDEGQESERTGGVGPTNGFWADAVWIPCRDGKARPAESGSFPLVTWAPARVVRLRGYGSAINAEQAKAFIESYLEVRAQ